VQLEFVVARSGVVTLLPLLLQHANQLLIQWTSQNDLLTRKTQNIYLWTNIL